MARRREEVAWRDAPTIVTCALLLGAVMRAFVLKLYVIPSASMEPTLRGGAGRRRDRVLVDKVSYRFAEPKAGDIVVFHSPSTWADEPNALPRLLRALRTTNAERPRYIKRVIATAGQTVAFDVTDRSVRVDGAAIDEPYVLDDRGATASGQLAFGPFTVPAGMLWVMGDNRSNSRDARELGPVPVRRVVGRARLIVGPLQRFGRIR